MDSLSSVMGNNVTRWSCIPLYCLLTCFGNYCYLIVYNELDAYC
jgi:hypothetical protein